MPISVVEPNSLIAHEPRIWQVDVSVNDLDQYPLSERAWPSIVKNYADYLPTIHRRLQELEQYAPRFDLCRYNAGMDPHEHYPMGGAFRALHLSLIPLLAGRRMNTNWLSGRLRHNLSHVWVIVSWRHS